MTFSNSLSAMIKAIPGGQSISDSIDRLIASITAGYNVQHNADDTHATITATGSISERGRTVPMGEWINPTFDASAFTVSGAGNSWTVPAPLANGYIAPISYMLVGKTMFLSVGITGSTLVASGSPTNVLRVQIPDKFQSANFINSALNIRLMNTPVYILNGAVQRTGHLFMTPADRTGIYVFRSDGSNFADDGSFEVGIQVFFEIS